MQRMGELIDAVRRRYPFDKFFHEFEEHVRYLPLKAQAYKVYEDALGTLDEESWRVLSGKAIEQFQNHRNGNWKQGFFNQLNEAFAYKHLKSMGCIEVKFLQEDGSICPDISYVDGLDQTFCEVKTISISDDEIGRRAEKKFTNSSQSGSLDAKCINKLNNTIDTAVRQMNKRGSVGLVYILMNCDDFWLEHVDRYEEQIRECLDAHSARHIFVQIGIFGVRTISKS
jgi:hypothetical protein